MLSQTLFQPKWSLLNARQKKKIRQEKQDITGEEKAERRKSRLLCHSLCGRLSKGRWNVVLGMREAQGGARGRREGKACKDAIIFYVVYIHQMNVKILIGQSSKHVTALIPQSDWLKSTSCNLSNFNNQSFNYVIVVSSQTPVWRNNYSKQE